MTSFSNREVGNAWTSFILGELYESWPMKINLNHLDIGSRTKVAPVRDEEILFDDLISWLEAEGYIRTSPQDAPEGNVFGVALTSKGYEILGNIPDSLSKPLGVRLKEAALEAGKDGAMKAGKESIAALIGMTFGAAIKTLTV
ncbi:conserved hypothetical protein [Rhodopseudomonas palustris HaA2]|uniref:Uncharacterized protein n=1 Tax=Rhodopseudomonas palustris (strain HaA2) TaxID=316058 RepID=Q2ITP0_RHOP2|nr:hypothetical protein [Rhodopseudomonas palustris]ABD08420.1 conserved hypothetical protein [Rhodopseudomonas palustris HaA2]